MGTCKTTTTMCVYRQSSNVDRVNIAICYTWFSWLCACLCLLVPNSLVSFISMRLCVIFLAGSFTQLKLWQVDDTTWLVKWPVSHHSHRIVPSSILISQQCASLPTCYYYLGLGLDSSTCCFIKSCSDDCLPSLHYLNILELMATLLLLPVTANVPKYPTQIYKQHL